MSTQHHHADWNPSEVAGARILVVQAGFNPEIVGALRAGAIAVFEKAGATVEVVTVPGALEIPAAIAYALKAQGARGRPWDGFVTLGCVIRGATGHYDIVANESNRALMDLALAQSLAIGNGILTVEDDEQAWERADATRLDKGGAAAAAVLSMIALRRRFGL